MELNPSAIVLDDLGARRYAEKLGLPVIGTVGLILKAKAAGLIPEVKVVLDELTGAGFYLSESLRRDALRVAME